MYIDGVSKAPPHENKGTPSASPSQVRILAAAIGLIQEKGGADVTMAEIAKAAGLSRQGVYLHFEDREALLLALARYADDRRGLDAEVEHVLRSSTGSEAIQGYVELLSRTNDAIWVLARAADAVRRTDPAVEHTWQERVRVRLRVCRAIVQRLQDEGTLKPEMEPEIAIDLLWALTALRTWEDLVQIRKWPAGKYATHICGMLTQAITQPVASA